MSSEPHRSETLRTRALTTPRGDELFVTLKRVLYLAAGIVALLWFAHEIQRVLLLGILAVILALALNAPVVAMERRGIGRGIATLVVFLATLSVVGLLGWLVGPRLVREIPTLIEQIPLLLEDLAQRMAIQFDDEVARQLLLVSEWMMTAVGQLWRQADMLLRSLVLVVFLLATVLYLVADPRPLLAGYVRAMPEAHRERATRAFARSSEMVVGWVASNVILGGIKAVVSFLFLSYLEIPGAVLWSVLALFAALVPRVGFYLMALPPVLMAATVEPIMALWVGLFYLVLSEFLGNFVAPKIREATMDLHPAYLLFMTLAMAYAFGIIGVLIAAPVAGFIHVFYDEFYLQRQPEDDRLDERVEAMLRRQPPD